MKSWGTRILFLYLSFVALIAILVTMSMKQKTDLVAKDYYARELAYQSKLDKMNRSHALTQPMRWVIQDHVLVLQFPAEVNAPVKGTVTLYCPADAGRDAVMNFNTRGKHVELNMASAKAGCYELQIDWQAGSQTYFDEGVINLP